jgi:drug/metabolite transporter (DMT)-like permease
LVVTVLCKAGYAIVVWAFNQELIAPVAILRETSILFAMLVSFFLIKETFSPLRFIIVCLIVSGIVLLGI